MTPLLPHLLTTDNLTPPTRTPWGGTRIAEHYKSRLGLPSGTRVGEAWEISVEPSFPSRLRGSLVSLSDCIAEDPVAWLGEAVAARHDGQLPLLIKLLDAEQNLSVQVHPSDDDPWLSRGESGKPEAWIILDAMPGAGIYLGWREGVSRAMVEDCLARQGALDALMNFVPVSRGDVFSVDAGVPHAIGAGVTLVEPQQVLPGRIGVTYRFWDWNRRYDDQGMPDPEGEPRRLHVERALAVSRWAGPLGEDFVERCRRQPGTLSAEGRTRRDVLVAGPNFWVERWAGRGSMALHPEGFLGIVCVAGSMRIHSESVGAEVTPVLLEMGQSAVVPAGLAQIRIEADNLEAYVGRPLAG